MSYKLQLSTYKAKNLHKQYLATKKQDVKGIIQKASMTAEMGYQEKSVTTRLPLDYHHVFKVIAADAAEEGMRL